MNPWKASLAFLALAALPIAQEEDQPEEPRGLRVHEDGAFEGYTLFTPTSSSTIYLIDMEGTVVHRWETELSSGALYLLDNGNLLRCARTDDSPRFNGGGIGGVVLPVFLVVQSAQRTPDVTGSAVVSVVALALVVFAELSGRQIFFKAQTAPRMPGVPK